jgi:hypothetical protein
MFEESRSSKIVCYEDVLTYEVFLSSHLVPNLPCILSPKQTADWHAFQEWVDRDGKPNWQFFEERFGSDQVSVAKCQVVEFGDQCRETMKVSDLVSKWTQGSDSGANQLYLKDWHLRLRNPTYDFYRTPDIFADDWMNDFYINARSKGDSSAELDDFRFLYMGTKGTFTPLHRDVYCSYSWSTNVVGCKKWTLFPPSVTKFLYSNRSRERVFDVRNYDGQRFPEFAKALDEAIIVVQKQGETIFVPSGWYHQVENLTDCISINHNWCNANSLSNMYSAMCQEIADVEHALSDVREMIVENWKPKGPEEIDGWQKEWVSIVQDVLVKNAGWGWLEFWSMVLHAVRTRWESGNWDAKEPTGGWVSAPQSLRPPWTRESAAITEILGNFRGERQEARWIPGLLNIIEQLEALLRQHSPKKSVSVSSSSN